MSYLTGLEEQGSQTGSGARLMGTDGSRQMEEWERESASPQSKERKQI